MGLGLAHGVIQGVGGLAVVLGRGLVTDHAPQLRFDGGGHFGTGTSSDPGDLFFNAPIGVDDKLQGFHERNRVVGWENVTKVRILGNIY